jgi:hypothetical protein
MDYTDINNNTLKRQYQDDIYANNNYKPVQQLSQLTSLKLPPLQLPTQVKTFKAEDIMEKLHPLVAQYYPYRHLYYSTQCKNTIINKFKKELHPDEQQIIHKYSLFKGLKQQTPEEKDISKKCKLILRKLERWYDKMGKDLYPELV